MAYTKSEGDPWLHVRRSRDALRRQIDDFIEGVSRPGSTPARQEVIRSSPPQRPTPRPQREWHDVFRGDE